ncbi:MAG: hypothetical protein Phog2KO_49490 [Phototrophicaceae bacterium]
MCVCFFSRIVGESEKVISREAKRAKQETMKKRDRRREGASQLTGDKIFLNIKNEK